MTHINMSYPMFSTTSQRRERTYLTVANRILDLIALGASQEGTRLPPDRELANMLGVGRNTLREALVALDLLGVLNVRQGSGIYVAAPSHLLNSPELLLLGIPLQYLEARRSVEPSIADICAKRATPQMMNELATTIETEQALPASNEPLHVPSRLSQLGLSYHTQLLACCGNPFLAGVGAPLLAIEANPLWSLANRLVLQNTRAQEEQIRSHALIFDAIAQHDGHRAASAMAEHIDCMTAFFPSSGADSPSMAVAVPHPPRRPDLDRFNQCIGGSLS